MKLENRFTVPVTADVAWQVLLDVERIAPCMPGATLTGQEGDTFTGTVKVKVGPIALTYGGKASFQSKDEGARVAVIEATGKETRGTGTAKATITARLHERDGSTEVHVETDLAVTGKPAQFGRGVLAEVSGKLVDQFAACLAEEISPKGVAATPPNPTGSPNPLGTAASSSANGSSRPAGSAGSTTPTGPSSPAGPSSPPGPPGPSSPAGPSSPSGPPGPSSPSGSPTLPGPGTLPGSASGALPPRMSAEPIDLLGTAGMPVLKRLGPLLAGFAGLIALLAAWRRRR